MAKTPNPQDATLRNIRAAGKRLDVLERKARTMNRLETRVRALEKAVAELRALIEKAIEEGKL